MKKKSESTFHSFCPFRAGIFISGLFLFCAAFNLAAQEFDQRSAESARIFYAEGMDFTVSQGGERSVFPAESARKEGIYLEHPAVINTGAGSFVEVQLIPSGTVIKLAENTSLTYNGFDETGKFTDFGLLYGRIRVVAGARTGETTPFVIRSGAISARFGEGDLGFDYILEPGSQSAAPRPLFRLYAFRGNAEVYPYIRGGAANFGGAEALSVMEGETLTLDVSSSHTFAERKELGSDITGYWRLHNFAGIPPLTMPDTGFKTEVAEYSVPQGTVVTGRFTPRVSASSPPASESQPLPLEPEETNAQLSVAKAKKTLLIFGLGMTILSVAVQGGAYYQYNESNNDVPRRIFTYAYIPLGFGVLSTLLGILYEPRVR